MGQSALDKRIAIADAFDSGVFTGMDTVDTDVVAGVVGFSPEVTSRLLKSLGVTQVSPSRQHHPRKDRIYAYPPRIRLPEIEGIKQPDVRVIVQAIYEHRLPRQFTVPLLYHRVGNDLSYGTIAAPNKMPDALRRGLSRQGFITFRPEGFKSELVKVPAKWRHPYEWPSLFQQQRQLRERGMSVSAIYRLTDSAAQVDGIIKDAMEALDLSRIPYDERGALKGQIRSIIKQSYTALLHLENEGAKSRQVDTMDWTALKGLSDSQLRNFSRIAANQSGRSDINPGTYALRWVQENVLSANAQTA